MTTRFDSKKESSNRLVHGYEGDNKAYDFTIPSCGLEDLDYAVFDLFNTQIPLFYNLKGERKKVPVIFATGERFAILRRKMPITDKKGALVLPLVSISRGSIENNPAKGIANNQMFPEVLVRRVAKENTAWRQQQNFEGFESLKHSAKNKAKKEFSLKPDLQNNIYETIEVPPVKYYGTSYEITVWSSFTQQMNELLGTILSSYTLNPGQQFKVESKKGYWFPAFVESSFSQDTSYADFTDAERYVKYTMTVSATGFILAPNIDGGKVGIKSMVSAPKISFEVNTNYENISPQIKGIPANSADARILDDLITEDGHQISQMVGVKDVENLDNLQNFDQSDAIVSGESDLKPYDFVGEKSNLHTNNKKVLVKNENGDVIPIIGKGNSSGETTFDQKYAEVIFNISNIDN